MSISVQEKFGSRTTTEGDNPSIELLFLVSGTSDDIAAKLQLDADSPYMYDGLVKQSLHLEPDGNYRWIGTVRYGLYQKPATNDNSYQFDTTGATTKITQSISTIGGYAPSGMSAPNFKGAIGYDGETIQGCDITIANYKWSETHYKPLGFITSAYRLGLANMTGTINGFPFRDFAAGEVLFLGAVGSQRGYEDWELQYHFAASPNLFNLSVGDITGIAKAGWDYLWVLYEEIDDAATNKLISTPRAAYVEKVYWRTDFSGLGIGILPL